MSWENVAGRALAAYGLEDLALSFIRHSDNVTYRVRKPNGDAYLLRIHVPVTAAMGAHGADCEAVRSELLWLEALCRDTDLALQQPVRNRAGELVTLVLSADGGPLHCTLLRWLEGQPYHRDLECKDTVRQIGQTMATLHDHASEWAIPEGFKRPRRDADYFWRMLEGVRPAVADGRIGAADLAVYERSIDLLIAAMSELDQGRQSYGIMHADGHKGNMLYHQGQIRLIDFSFCAFGNYMFDLGICLADMKQSLHGAFLDGYQGLRPLPPGYAHLIEGFFVCSMVGTFCYWVDNPRAQELLARKVPQIARDYAVKFNRGQPFWFMGSR